MLGFASPRQQKRVKAELMSYGLDPDVVAQNYDMKGDVVDRLHRWLALAEARRTAIARNFNEYRAMAPLSDKSAVDPKRSPWCRALTRRDNTKTNCR
jgi:hypothetical protein